MKIADASSDAIAREPFASDHEEYECDDDEGRGYEFDPAVVGMEGVNGA